MTIEVKHLKELIKLAKMFDLAELEVESKGDRVKIKRSSENGAPPAYMPQYFSHAPSQPPPPAQDSAIQAAPAAAKAEDASVAFITSPFVGTFYRSPSPDAPSFVEVGQKIERGQVLCIVEAMKLMNEIESELSGTVLEVLIQNGKAVEYGDKLFKIKKV